jgi:formate hydrogenlyase subunit 4
MTSAIVDVLQVLLLLFLSPLIAGLIKTIKARLQGRRGPSPIQGYFDLIRLFRKEVVVSRHASWIFHVTPFICFISIIAVCAITPVLSVRTSLGFAGDLIALVYLLALFRFFMALAALDTGSAFGGMGASREMTLSSVAEPAMMVSIFTLALTAGSTSLDHIVSHVQTMGFEAVTPAHILAFGALFLVTLAETGRIPVDNPATHLELTMIHEGMLLEYSGRYLALMEWSSSIKLIIFLTLLGNLFFPWGIADDLTPSGLLISALSYSVKLFAGAAVIGIIETYFAKLRIFRVPDLLGSALMLGILALITFYLFR